MSRVRIVGEMYSSVLEKCILFWYFYKMFYLNVFRQFVDRTPVSLTSDKNNAYFK